MSPNRRAVHFNKDARSWIAPASPDADSAAKFHKTLPHYQPSRLESLPYLASKFGVGAMYVKDESNRLDLPSFKILGASWGTFRAISQKLNLPLDSTLESVKEACNGRELKLFAATEGNHGRAVARMGSLLSIPVEIHVPATMPQSTITPIESEGAAVVQSIGSYEVAMQVALENSKACTGGLLIQDTAFPEYEQIPGWIVEGYSTMHSEVDDQLGSIRPDLVISPVGVGSLAQSVVAYYKGPGRQTAVLTVEPDTAGCLWKSLRKGKAIDVETSTTIMNGLNCGTVSSLAWPLFRDGVDASLTVSDYEAHIAAAELAAMGINAGPCGASPLAALHRLTEEDKKQLGLGHDSVVVLLCTEGMRDYKKPFDVSINDPVTLTQTLVQINSASPSLGSVPGPGETEIARYVKAWLEYRDIESHCIEPTKGRPSVVGVVRGSGDGKSLMFNGHLDTVTLMGYEDDPLSGRIQDGKLYGRGAADMKCGVAAAMIAMGRARTHVGLRGDVIFTGVADEEAISIGTEQVLAAGWRADAAIVNEPTDLNVYNAHKGFVWAEVDIHGVAAHGSRHDLGTDAICKAGLFLAELGKHAKEISEKPGDPIVGPGTVHASLIKGGEEASSYPALCTITLERRTIPGETPQTVKEELEALLQKVAHSDPEFKFDLRITFNRSPFSIPRDDPFAELVGKHIGKSLGRDATFLGGAFWTDCALLADAGIKPLLWGPIGAGLHAKEEWVDVQSIRTVADTLTAIIEEFCA